MKKVKFNLNKNIQYTTYSSDEYSRCPIDSVLYLKSYNKISDTEWKIIMFQLNEYKLNEMIVHKDSIRNIKIN